MSIFRKLLYIDFIRRFLTMKVSTFDVQFAVLFLASSRIISTKFHLLQLRAVHLVFVVLFVRNWKSLRKVEKILHQLPFYFCQLLILLLWSVHCTVRSKITVYQRLRPIYIFLFLFLRWNPIFVLAHHAAPIHIKCRHRDLDTKTR